MCNCWLESVVHMVANERATEVFLSLDVVLLQHRLNSAIAWAMLDGDFLQLVYHLLQLTILQRMDKLHKSQSLRTQATMSF